MQTLLDVQIAYDEKNDVFKVCVPRPGNNGTFVWIPINEFLNRLRLFYGLPTQAIELIGLKAIDARERLTQ